MGIYFTIAAWASMRTNSKTSALALILFIALPSLMILALEPAAAQTIPPPSVPQFTVQFVNSSYGVTTTNPYTGQNQTQQVSNCTIQITITNQNNYALLNSTGDYHIFYGLRMSPHFENDWTELGGLSYLASAPGTNGNSPCAYYITDLTFQSIGNYTVITLPVTPTDSSGSVFNVWALSAIPYNGQIDFQVEALVGHNSTYWAPDPNPEVPWHPYGSTPVPMPPQGWYVPAIGYDNLNSTWSSTQTIQLGENSTPDVSSPTFIPVMPALVWLVIGAVLGSALVLFVVVRFRLFNH
jgi:hypothetical protein